ncbi:hypothetical protein C1H46_013430 [Malus baccata]|uniref:Uncharacterized protein n=1 Tax=Malus baccata TaxID=106549 RepID=A0A540MRA3_MALBA|nr:hypothetical protein C1H46_013430 [Malus baccata]
MLTEKGYIPILLWNLIKFSLEAVGNPKNLLPHILTAIGYIEKMSQVVDCGFDP